MSVFISVILISYNCQESILAAIPQVQRSLHSITHEIIVVDNASSDSSVALINRLSGPLTVIANGKNVGFARAVNQALDRAHGQFVLLLNPDCELQEGSLRELLKYGAAHSEAGVVGPAIMSRDSQSPVLSAGHLPKISRVFVHAMGLSRVRIGTWSPRGMHLIARAADASAIDVEWVSGACLLIRRQVLRDLGGLCTRWFMYAEDMELCGRVLDLGLRVVQLSSAKAYHTPGALRNGTSMMWLDNLEDFYVYRFGPTRKTLWAWRMALALGFVLRALGYAVKSVFKGGVRTDLRRSNQFLQFARHVVVPSARLPTTSTG